MNSKAQDFHEVLLCIFDLHKLFPFDVDRVKMFPNLFRKPPNSSTYTFKSIFLLVLIKFSNFQVLIPWKPLYLCITYICECIHCRYEDKQ